jgi:hypothetical protein
MPSVIVQSAVGLSVFMLNVIGVECLNHTCIMLSVIIQSAIGLSVFMLNVAAPKTENKFFQLRQKNGSGRH